MLCADGFVFHPDRFFLCELKHFLCTLCKSIEHHIQSSPSVYIYTIHSLKTRTLLLKEKPILPYVFNRTRGNPFFNKLTLTIFDLIIRNCRSMCKTPAHSSAFFSFTDDLSTLSLSRNNF